MLCVGVVAQPGDVVGGVLVLEVAEVRLLLEQPLGVAHVAVEEHAHRQAQVGEQPLVQVDDLAHAGLGEAARLLHQLVLDVLQDALDDVADLLHVDRERDDVGPAAALLLRERLARDLRQVELDRRIELVDRVVELAQLLRELQVVLAQHRQDAAQHGLDDVGLVQRLARGARDRERRHVEGERVEMARAQAAGARMRVGQPAVDGAADQPGEADEEHGEDEVEGEVEADDLLVHRRAAAAAAGRAPAAGRR